MMPNSKSRKTEDISGAILRHWREELPNDRLAHLIKDSARALVGALQRHLVEHDVPFGHWAFLRILWEGDGLTQQQLATEAGVMPSTTSTALAAMEALDYITRRQSPDNRKNVYVYLTAKGRRLKPVLVPLAVAVDARAVRGVSERDLKIVRNALLKIIENLAEDEAGELAAGHVSPSPRKKPDVADQPRRRSKRQK